MFTLQLVSGYDVYSLVFVVDSLYVSICTVVDSRRI